MMEQALQGKNDNGNEGPRNQYHGHHPHSHDPFGDSRRRQLDFQYILPGAVGLPRGSNLYLWNPHIICGRTVEPACATGDKHESVSFF